MKKNKCFGFIAMVLLGLFTAPGLVAQTTIQQTYYVNATTGNDANNGRREEAPFKTMQKAIESAGMGVVRTITIIGSVNGFRIEGTGSNEITITGKPNATEAEKAKINGRVDISQNTVVKFIYLTIENPGGNGISSEGKVTLGRNAVIQNCLGYGVSVGINYQGQQEQIVLTENAVITGCKESGVRSDGGSVIMTDDSSITNNQIGIRSYDERFSLTMSGNAKISYNQNSGVKSDDNNTPVGTVTISGNTEISYNTTVSATRDSNRSPIRGGGVYVRNFVMNGGKIINNTASENGGGVYCNNAKITGGEISGNQAEKGGGVYISSAWDRSSTITGGVITKNKADYGAGIFVESRHSLAISRANINLNEAEFVGGGLYLESGATYTASSGIITRNTAGDGVGHDVFNQ